jgi:radical SAM family uncharacterized protein/radical SAM-linked protein
MAMRDILPLVSKPARYLGTEPNSVRKDPGNVRLKFALAFPDVYEIGMSHLGIQILYRVLNSREDIACERVFSPWVDMSDELKANRIALTSLESQTPLSKFDIVGFSLQYELSYTNVLDILNLAGIPLLSKERGEDYPLVIAGGPCCFNPEPVADFLDAVVIGEGEEVIIEVCDSYMDWKRGGGSKRDLLLELSKINGVYIPSFFDVTYDSDGKIKEIMPTVDNYHAVRRRVIKDINDVSFPTRPIVPFVRTVHDRLAIEICRGCTRGCRFCQAGIIYRPVRERRKEEILRIAKKSLGSTGYQELSLLSLSVGDYSGIKDLVESLMAICAPKNLALSLPSLRIGTITSTLIREISRVRKTGFTIAPESGTQRLRNVINKDITENEIIETSKDIYAAGWNLIKLYFMVGLPTETMGDVEAIGDLSKRILMSSDRPKNVNVSISTFVPKAHTPFQWRAQISLEESRRRIDLIRQVLKRRGLHVKWNSPRLSWLEGIFARGDRRLGRALLTAHRLGCCYDGWSDRMRYGRWREAFSQSKIDPEFYLASERKAMEVLPWDHIQTGVNKDFLMNEYEKALSETPTLDCRFHDCNQCGACELPAVRPVISERKEGIVVWKKMITTKHLGKPRRYRLIFSKQGPARFFGHLDMMNIFIRAFGRAGISFNYSNGFHPLPRMSFANALPLGMESLREYLDLEILDFFAPSDLVKQINPHLPEGLEILEAYPVPLSSAFPGSDENHYLITFPIGKIKPERLSDFERCSQWVIELKKKNRKQRIDLKSAVSAMELENGRTLRLTIKGGISPKDVIGQLFCLEERDIALAKITKGKGVANRKSVGN